MNRRLFLSQLLTTSAATIAHSASARSANADLTFVPLADGLTLLSGGGGNVVLFNTPEGVLLVDGGSQARSAAVLQAVRKLTGTARVHTLFNTHWHWDQTGSNAILGAAGTRIIAHENTRLWLSTEVDSKWESRVYDRLPPLARPNQTFYTTGTLEFAGEQIDYGHLPQAHTDGDIFVFFRKANVLVAGGVVSVGTYPILDYSTGGWLGGMVAATQTLLELGNSGTKIIPGTGPVQSRADVKAENDMLAVLRQRLPKLLAQGLSAQEMIAAAPTREFDAKWGDPTLFIAMAWQGMVRRPGDLGVAIV